ncbi:bifunctional ADP-dependent NAD(P)H-hydrate dehydratase/NAD(P)H-hydrate epimerase [Celeribacter indicus]|uniref:Bifunctional NAD(P)H-hydrate repair enzyme n=1 Tax=Celeribacter indicus TaxID=1208324 RepID=A0A0B5DS57_9RHOB|nr:bifunctional ADP-dependent NAD(P)H-hydrate dehydratase/NAD(P)H-hydrate epimerase [Celeribacter indicus]AJE46358.1 hypothetical protein P73_1643 [Celeribacter indicus]SDW54455.1 yjeF C-terminal region, hydroxyethylthiazole kinase-related/yjeF N-terminal region [Celeribacter indicus]
MAELLTSAQMRAIEGAVIDRGAVTGLDLMERAGQGVVDAVFEEWPELARSSHRATVLCGPGNNGGDGFVIARLLKQRGWEVEVFLYGDPAKLPPDATVNYGRWAELGSVSELRKTGAWVEPLLQADLCVDALFGTGLTRPFDDDHAEALGAYVLEAYNNIFSGARAPYIDRIVAVDVPSGLCADSGRVLSAQGAEETDPTKRSGVCFGADLTVTFHRAKLGQYLGEGPELCGKLVVADIGLWGGVTGAPPVRQVDAAVLRGHGLRPDVGKRADQHKYSHGHALILSGLSGKTGAARLAARAALRVGAGLVTLGTPHAAVTEVAAQLTAIMLREIDTPETLTRVLADQRLTALCLGPGFGIDRAREFLPCVLAAHRATVLDADALTALAEGETAFAALHDRCVLTPHAGEFERLFPDIAARLAEPPTKGPAYSKVDATRDAARRAGCPVLFKGSDTVIASPDGRCSVNAAVYDRAAPWLATAGTGDVLAGLIAGLLARGFAPDHAAETAAWLHVEAAYSFGPGLIAEDLPEELPTVFRTLGL